MARLLVGNYVGPSVAWMDNGSVGPSVRRGSESMCGALRALDVSTVNMWDPH